MAFHLQFSHTETTKKKRYLSKDRGKHNMQKQIGVAARVPTLHRDNMLSMNEGEQYAMLTNGGSSGSNTSVGQYDKNAMQTADFFKTFEAIMSIIKIGRMYDTYLRKSA